MKLKADDCCRSIGRHLQAVGTHCKYCEKIAMRMIARRQQHEGVRLLGLYDDRFPGELRPEARGCDDFIAHPLHRGEGSGSFGGLAREERSIPIPSHEAREVAGVRVLAKEARDLDAAGMRQLSDTLLARIKSGVVVLGRTNDGKASLIVRTSDDLTKRIPAGQVIKELAPIIGGRGGGKADMAEGGGNQPEKLSEALQASYQVIEKILAS